MRLFSTKKGRAEVSGAPGTGVFRRPQLGRPREAISRSKTTNSWPWVLRPPPSSTLGPSHTAEGLELEARQGAGALAWVGAGEAALERRAAPFPEKGSLTGRP